MGLDHQRHLPKCRGGTRTPAHYPPVPPTRPQPPPMHTSCSVPSLISAPPRPSPNLAIISHLEDCSEGRCFLGTLISRWKDPIMCGQVTWVPTGGLNTGIPHYYPYRYIMLFEDGCHQDTGTTLLHRLHTHKVIPARTCTTRLAHNATTHIYGNGESVFS